MTTLSHPHHCSIRFGDQRPLLPRHLHPLSQLLRQETANQTRHLPWAEGFLRLFRCPRPPKQLSKIKGINLTQVQVRILEFHWSLKELVPRRSLDPPLKQSLANWLPR